MNSRCAAVLGAGSWGTALAMVLSANHHSVQVWSNDPEELSRMERTRRLLHKLPDVKIPEDIGFSSEPASFMENAELLVVAIPSRYIADFARSFLPHISGNPKTVVCATKGLDAENLTTMSEILEAEWNASPSIRGIVALSGPTHAEEVARRLPTAIVAAHTDLSLAETVQTYFQAHTFRVYTNPDRKGVEFGGALKNILAIAVGISDGLGFGDNARAALISRGLYEISQAGAAMGAQTETFAGLSGMGDLVVTCTSRHSRNRRFGELIARGYLPADAEEEIGMAVEGVTAVKAIPTIVARHKVDLPISEEVYRVVHETADPRTSVESLMMRETRSERV